jgi:hypothetical protein
MAKIREDTKYMVQLMVSDKGYPDLESAVSKMFSFMEHTYNNVKQEHAKYNHKNPKSFPIVHGQRIEIEITINKERTKYIHKSIPETLELIRSNIEASTDIFMRMWIIGGDDHHEGIGEVTRIKTIKQYLAYGEESRNSLMKILPKGVTAVSADGTVTRSIQN